MNRMNKRFICYNAILVIFCLLKYILYINIFNQYILIFEAISTLVMTYLYIKIFSWGKLKYKCIYIIYILLVISIWTIVSIKIDYVGKFNEIEVINCILFYNLKNFSTYLFIILEPIMIVDREYEE